MTDKKKGRPKVIFNIRNSTVTNSGTGFLASDKADLEVNAENLNVVNCKEGVSHRGSKNESTNDDLDNYLEKEKTAPSSQRPLLSLFLKHPIISSIVAGIILIPISIWFTPYIQGLLQQTQQQIQE